MRHVCLTCKNHPELRWSCKSIAFTPGHGYNGSRNIFFMGDSTRPDALAIPGIIAREMKEPIPDHYVIECPCPAGDLILAPGETMPEDD